MSKFEKLLKRIKSMNKDMRFDELKKVLESYGYTMSSPSSGSSHRTFRKFGKMPIIIPDTEPIKLAYVIMVKRIIEEKEDESK